MTTESTRDLGASDKADDFTPVGRRFVTVIGIDQYAHLPKLGNAVSDAVGVRQLFVEKLGFTSTADLFDADATKDAIVSLVEDKLRELLEPDDALLLLFAGHGHTRLDKIGDKEVETGFLVPVEAQDRGELVISLRDDSFDAVKARAFAALQRGAMVDFADRVEQAMKAKPDSAETKYLRLRLALYVDTIDEAVALAEHLSGQYLAKGAIPLENNDLWNLRNQLPYYRELLTLPAIDFEPVVEVLYGPSRENLAPLVLGTVDNRPGYRIPVGSYYGFRFNNPLNHPLHIYLLRVDTAGRLRFMTLWNNTELLVSGLPPSETVVSFPFATGVPGMNQMSFVGSPTMLPQLLAPPEVGTRGIIGPIGFPAGVTTLKLLHVVMPKDGSQAD
jgi:hypothetical protein